MAAPVHAVAVARDTADNRLLEAALAGEAEMIVSGDEDLLVLRAFRGIPIVTPTAAHSTIRGTE